MENSQLNQSWWSLRITYGLVAFLAGLDKFFHVLTNWDNYLSPAVTSLVPVSAPTLMHVVGIVEMAVGLLILTRWTRIGAYIASVWLLCIAFNLVLTGSFFDVAVRDVALSVGAFTLARLSEAHEPVSHTVSASVRPAHI
jgi:uncharacterized membrane protein YphA (DoxX/SURF4 family)